MKKILLAVQGPIQMVAGYIAMTWYQSLQDKTDEDEYTLLLYDFMASKDIENAFYKCMNMLASITKWKNIKFIESEVMNKLYKDKYENSISGLKKIISEDKFDILFIGRDFLGVGSPLIINSYSEAVKVIYGDSLGLVGDESDHEIQISKPLIFITHKLKKYIRKIIYGGPVKYNFDIAILSIPIEWRDGYLQKMKLLVPSKEHVIKIIAIFSKIISECNSPLPTISNGNKNYLFILGNLSAAGLMSKNNEIDLYVKIIMKYVELNSNIYIKGHPRDTNGIKKLVYEKIKNNKFDKIVIDFGNYESYPIELWIKYLPDCTVIPTYSTSSISLHYLYGINIIFTISNEMIKKYFYKDKIKFARKNLQVMEEATNNIANWGGDCVLWPHKI